MSGDLPVREAIAKWAPKSVDSQSFPRKARLLTPADYKKVFKNAVVSSDNYFKVFARFGDTPRSRLGMAVSRKVDSRATVRNRIKRVVRESFRANHPGGDQGGDAQPGRDYVVLAAASAARARNLDLTESLSRHWRQIDRKLGRRGDHQPWPDSDHVSNS